MWFDNIKALVLQRPTAAFPGIPCIFNIKHSKMVISPCTVFHFNDGIRRAIGHYGSLMMSADGRTMPDISKPADKTTEIFHVHASILNDYQIFGEAVSPLLWLFTYTGIQNEQVETVS